MSLAGMMPSDAGPKHGCTALVASDTVSSSGPADTTYTSFYVVWATGYALDLTPELPTLVTYKKSAIPATTTDTQAYVWISATQ